MLFGCHVSASGSGTVCVSAPLSPAHVSPLPAPAPSPMASSTDQLCLLTVGLASQLAAVSVVAQGSVCDDASPTAATSSSSAILACFDPVSSLVSHGTDCAGEVDRAWKLVLRVSTRSAGGVGSTLAHGSSVGRDAGRWAGTSTSSFQGLLLDQGASIPPPTSPPTVQMGLR